MRPAHKPPRAIHKKTDGDSHYDLLPVAAAVYGHAEGGDRTPLVAIQTTQPIHRQATHCYAGMTDFILDLLGWSTTTPRDRKLQSASLEIDKAVRRITDYQIDRENLEEALRQKLLLARRAARPIAIQLLILKSIKRARRDVLTAAEKIYQLDDRRCDLQQLIGVTTPMFTAETCALKILSSFSKKFDPALIDQMVEKFDSAAVDLTSFNRSAQALSETPLDPAALQVSDEELLHELESFDLEETDPAHELESALASSTASHRRGRKATLSETADTDAGAGAAGSTPAPAQRDMLLGV